MPVAKNKKVVMLLVQHFFAIANQPFFIFSQKLRIILACCRPAAFARPVCYTHAYIRREQAKQPLTGFIPEYLF